VPAVDGAASPAGTRRFAARAIRERQLPAAHFREAPLGLTVSSLGLGTYIGPPDGPTDLAVEQAVAICLTSGRVNVIDTAINYRHQRAERSIGRALARLVAQRSVARDEVLVATKAGYLAPDGEARIAPDRWIERELVAPGHLDPADVVDGSHAMSPSYLADQFARSRSNLGVATIDLLYLHNGPDAQLVAVGAEAFARRLESAFRLYERWRADGTLGAYGLATWDCLRRPPDDPGFFPVETAVEIARAAGGKEHGFRYLQFPFNVGMPEAAAVANQPVAGRRVTLFRAAAELGLGCFTSVPLHQGQLARNGPKRNGLSPAQTALQFARSAPGTLGPLVGQKRTEHLSENLEVAQRPPWDEPTFRAFLA
jgi:aryl-alcohol dehydrogenase-like predicted oxidoreductase